MMTKDVTFDFSDKSVPYDVFIRDVASTMLKMMCKVKDDPEFVCQNKAFKMFGRANVERWRRTGKVTAFIRPGKTEYRTAELRAQQVMVQDYLTK